MKNWDAEGIASDVNDFKCIWVQTANNDNLKKIGLLFVVVAIEKEKRPGWVDFIIYSDTIFCLPR